MDSPSRYSVNESARGVPRGDSLAYSEDSHEFQRTLVNPQQTYVQQENQSRPKQVFKKPWEKHESAQTRIRVNESQLSEESLQSRNSSACCTIQ